MEQLALYRALAAPDLLDPKSAAQNSKPRLSFSTKPTVLASRVESDTTINVMKWKTVSTIFLVVVLYLIIGATVFKALEQPHEISQRTTIVIQKQTFISQHACVNSTELDELIQPRRLWPPFPFLVIVLPPSFPAFGVSSLPSPLFLLLAAPSRPLLPSCFSASVLLSLLSFCHSPFFPFALSWYCQ
ncbi:hypothetical protein FD754_022459 [Muntiacus muntjak]|uniref:Potassium channel domain-containing protein n=1 Tax=Muntiacus muntjak TaxID=9888 RepID=A0A5N3V8T2_MUNMU|nr:hypothetical protein FD754_022459 [Muntiacus muntjak]